MKKEQVLVLLPLVLLIGWSSGQQQPACIQDNFGNVNVTYDDVRRTTVFGLDLFKAMKNMLPGRNLFFSPYSIWSVLTIAYFGAEGNTLTELQRALRLRAKDAAFKTQRLLSFQFREIQGVDLEEANRAYLDSNLPLNRCFQRDQFFDVRSADLSNPARTAQEVNSFVNQATKGLIPQLLNAASLQRTRFVLVNAIYFKGDWRDSFQIDGTRKMSFCTSPADCSTRVDMMVRPKIGVPYVNNTQLGAEVIELPYGSSSISMLLFLPWKDSNTVDRVVDLLSLNSVAATIGALKTEEMRVQMPKFKMEQTLQGELKDALSLLGIKDLFDASRADLTGFTTRGVSVTDAIHKAVIDLDEKGTRAAAATALFDTRIGGPPTRTITFNRPFVFMIVDKQLGLILFNGIYRRP